MQQAADSFAPLLASRAVGALALASGTVTTTSSNFTTFLERMPWATTFSMAPEVKVVLATIPLLALGVTGVALAALVISLGRMNRSFVNLFVAVGVAWAAGIFQLFNVLTTEFNGASRLGKPLFIAEALSIATLITFKFLFLFRRSQDPSIYETNLPPNGAILPTVRWSVRSRVPSPSSVHSGSFDRWGVIGDVVRVGMFLLILVTGLLESIWRLGINVSFSAFSGTYKASNSVQIVLLVIFFGKFMSSATLVKARPRKRNFFEVLPILFAITIALGISIANLAPGLFNFAATPLGRFLILVEMFTYLVTMVIQDARRAFRDSSSSEYLLSTSHAPSKLDSKLQTNLDSKIDVKDSNVTRVEQEPALPERIVVRRSSRIPSWLGASSPYASDRQSLTKGAMPPGRTEDELEAQASPTDVYNAYYDEGTYGEALSRYDSGMMAPSFPQSVRQSEASVQDRRDNDRITFSGRLASLPEMAERNPTSLTRPNSLAPQLNRHTRNLSTAAYDLKGIRLSSPNLDLQFSFDSIIRRQQELEAIAHAEVRAKVAAPRTPPPPQRPPPPSSMPIPPPPIDAPALFPRPTPQPKQPAPLPVPLGIGIDVSAYMPTLTALSTETKTSSDGSSPVGLGIDEAVRQSGVSNHSDFSLSNFPRPPVEGGLPLGLADTSSLASRQSTPEDVRFSAAPTTKTNYSRTTTNVVMEGGLEFELFAPQHASFDSGDGRYQSLDIQQDGLAYDVTSMLVADLSQSDRISALRRELRRASSPLESPSDPRSTSPDPMPTSPAPSEIGEILQATVVARQTSQSQSVVRQDSKLRVEGRGREIPPRADQDEGRVRSQEISIPVGTLGLPSNPRRSPRSQEDSTPTTPLTRFNSTSSSSNDTSVATYDPRKPFEKPRPAPLVLVGKESSEVGKVSMGALVVAKAAARRLRTRGGRRKEITIIREEEAGGL